MIRYDYLPKGFDAPNLLSAGMSLEAVDPSISNWPYLRSEIPHIFRIDRRSKSERIIGLASYEEAVVIHNCAKIYKGGNALEIGTHFGWTAYAIATAGLSISCVDVNFNLASQRNAVGDLLKDHCDFNLHAGFSLDILPTLQSKYFDFALIDGSHSGDDPLNDTRAVLQLMKDNSTIIFHDLNAPSVSNALNWLAEQENWQVGYFKTMQLLGVAWRGSSELPKHLWDRNITLEDPNHLQQIKLLSL